MDRTKQRGRLAGKVAVVTGAGGGIGAEIARRFAAEGARVVVAEIREETGEATAAAIRAQGGDARFVAVDVAAAGQVERLFRDVEATDGGLDVLVNNANDIRGDTTICDLEEAVFDRVIAVDLKGPFLCTRQAVGLMSRRGGGSIVTLSSVNALFGFGHTAYTAAKGGLISMMRLVAAEYGHLGIRSNVICPGTIGTETSLSIWQSNPEGYRRLLEMYPLGRIGTPEEVASYVLFLASDESAFVTGSVQVIDGGILAGRRFEF
jgi:3-oxoacyl-[acyl-carrier protein] reductase